MQRLTDSDSRGIGFPAVLVHAVFLQVAVYLIRPTTSYRALELGIDPGMLGLVVASFSILPVFLALWLGRRTDAGYESQVLVTGALLMLGSGAGLLFAAPTLPALLGWNLILGIGHLMCLLGEQSRLASAKSANMDRVFGFYTTATALAQMVAPLILAVMGGAAIRPDTGRLLAAYLVAVLGLLVATGFMVVGCFGPGVGDRTALPPTLRSALALDPRARRTLVSSIVLSMMVLCTIDLLQVYLPALAVERGIPASVVGVLLALRAAATVVSRYGLDRLVRWFGRTRLLLVSTGMSAVLVAAIALPIPVIWLGVLLLAAGLCLGVGQPLSMSVVSMAASEGTRGTWMSIRLMGTRLGQAVIPVGIGLFAAGSGAGAVFLALGGVMTVASVASVPALIQGVSAGNHS